MFVKVVKLSQSTDRYTELQGDHNIKFSLQEAVINTEKIISIEESNISIEEVIKQYPELSEHASVSRILYEEGQHTNRIFVIGSVDFLIQKFNNSKQLLKG